MICGHPGRIPISGESGETVTTETVEDTPFALALREAIERRGLGLGRIVARLEEAGTPVSAATLSYWQSGRSRPGRRASLASLSTLEHILGVPPGQLAGQLGRPATRGRNPQPPTWVELWDEIPAAATAFELLGSGYEDHLTRISYHDRVVIGADRTERSTMTRQVMRADIDGVDRFMTMYGNDDPAVPLPEVLALERCRVGRVDSVPDSGIITAELLLPRPLRRGEFVTVDYGYVQAAPYPPGDRYERRRRTATRQYILEVAFDPAAQPVRCERYTQSLEGPETVEPLEVDPENGLLLVELDGRPGTVGARWKWPDDRL